MSQPYQLTLISHPLCPFVQRSVIALNAMGRDYKRIDIDLGNKPGWFKEISPLGKVPVLVVNDDKVIFESNVIAEFANDICDSALLPTDPVEKAQQRAWIEFAGEALMNVGKLYNCKEQNQFDEALEALQKKWTALEVVLPEQGFFNGEKFSLVDAAFGPVFRYFNVLEKFGDWPFIPAGTKVAKYRETIRQHPAVIAAVAEDYEEAMAVYIAAKSSWMGGVISKQLPM